MHRPSLSPTPLTPLTHELNYKSEEQLGRTFFFTVARSTDEFTSLSNELTNIKRNSAAFSYQPSTIAQDRYPGNKGIYGDFILRYDVRHSYDVGYVLVSLRKFSFICLKEVVLSCNCVPELGVVR